MTAQPLPQHPPPLPPLAAWPTTLATPVGHLVCDASGRVCWADTLATDLLAAARVLLLQDDGRLGVRSHRLGLLALRGAMRRACLGLTEAAITLRHDRHALQVGVHALPDAADGSQRVLLSLRPVHETSPPSPPLDDWTE